MSDPIGLQLRNTANQLPPRTGPRHDNLHMAEGLKHCWCICSRCFMKYHDGTGGICICRQCPCAEYYNSTIPM